MIGKTVVKFSSYTWLLIVSTVLLLGLAGCGGSDAGTGAAPGGDLQLSLSTDPNPPAAGPVTLTVEVKDAKGQPVDGATVSVSAKHTGMSHGGIDGQLASRGSGRYQASGSFSMAGTWRATVTVSKEGLSSKTQAFDLPVR